MEKHVVQKDCLRVRGRWIHVWVGKLLEVRLIFWEGASLYILVLDLLVRLEMIAAAMDPL